MFNHKENLTEEKKINGGVQYIFKFENRYGASVVRHSFSYGNVAGLWELGVLDFDGALCYDTPITDDVIGWLEPNGVERILNQIKELPNEQQQR